jgi:hypothetical protein
VVNIHSRLSDFFVEKIVFAISEPTDSLGGRRIGRVSVGNRNPSRVQEARNSLVAGLAIDIGQIVTFNREFTIGLVQPDRPFLQELVE